MLAVKQSEVNIVWVERSFNVEMVSETLASNCTACSMCEGLSESINKRISWLLCQSHNGVSRAIYSAIKAKRFSQSLRTPSGQWSHFHGEITQYAIPLTEDNARNCISFSFFGFCERGMEITLHCSLENDEKKKVFFFIFSFRLSFFSHCKRPRSMARKAQ